MSAASSSKACNFSIVFSALFALECPGKLSHLIKLIGEVFKFLWTIVYRLRAQQLFAFRFQRGEALLLFESSLDYRIPERRNTDPNPLIINAVNNKRKTGSAWVVSLMAKDAHDQIQLQRTGGHGCGCPVQLV